MTDLIACSNADLASIRRCRDLDDVYFTPAFYKIKMPDIGSKRKRAMFLYIYSKIKTGTINFNMFLASDDFKDVRLKHLFASRDDLKFCKNMVSACKIARGVTAESLLDFVKYYPKHDNKKSKAAIISRIYEEKYKPKYITKGDTK